MVKRKCDGELVKFVWKRNVKYDIMLLAEVQEKNPFAFKNAKITWEEIAKVLQNGSLKMKVTYRSCRERVKELLKVHRGDERRSKAASGIEEPEMTELQNLLTSVAELHKGGHDEEVRDVYSNDRSECEAIRAAALENVQNDSDESSERFIHATNFIHNVSNGEITEAGSSSVSNLDIDWNDADIIEVIACDDVTEVTASNTASSNANATNRKALSASNHSNLTSSVGGQTSIRGCDKNWAAVQMFFSDGGVDRVEGEENRSELDPSEQLITRPHKANAKKDLVRYKWNSQKKCKRFLLQLELIVCKRN